MFYIIYRGRRLVAAWFKEDECNPLPNPLQPAPQPAPPFLAAYLSFLIIIYYYTAKKVTKQ